jgi:hypothetical protein
MRRRRKAKVRHELRGASAHDAHPSPVRLEEGDRGSVARELDEGKGGPDPAEEAAPAGTRSRGRPHAASTMLGQRGEKAANRAVGRTAPLLGGHHADRLGAGGVPRPARHREGEPYATERAPPLEDLGSRSVREAAAHEGTGGKVDGDPVRSGSEQQAVEGALGPLCTGSAGGDAARDSEAGAGHGGLIIADLAASAPPWCR